MAEINIKDIFDAMEEPARAIEEAECLYEAHIHQLARRIVEGGDIRVVLLSGPSGSGKTTTANLIADKIRDMGEKSLVISMDDFYKNWDDSTYPLDHDGNRDFESPDALDDECMMRTLDAIIDGREFSVPKYDFKVSGRCGFTPYPSFADGCVIVEGIHALNPRFSAPYGADKVLKVFVSVSTNINDENGRIMSGKKMRFVRRAVRDSIYRGADVKRTLDMWADVLRGEEEYLYPYKDSADVKFDTFHIFEPAVMRDFLLRLLPEEIAARNKYALAVRSAMLRMPACSEELVPETSLIREFIPGGKYEDLY